MKTAVFAMGEKKHISFIHQLGTWMGQSKEPAYQKYRLDETWSPSINLYESEDHFCLIADLAGLRAEDIDLRVEKDILILEGTRPTPILQSRGCIRAHLMEIDHGRFHRALKLPDNTDVDAIEATYRLGYLWIQLPKKN